MATSSDLRSARIFVRLHRHLADSALMQVNNYCVYDGALHSVG